VFGAQSSLLSTLKVNLRVGRGIFRPPGDEGQEEAGNLYSGTSSSQGIGDGDIGKESHKKVCEG